MQRTLLCERQRDLKPAARRHRMVSAPEGISLGQNSIRYRKFFTVTENYAVSYTEFGKNSAKIVIKLTIKIKFVKNI